MKSIVYVGLDVHKDSIAVAVAHEGAAGVVESLGTIPNRTESVDRLMRKLYALGASAPTRAPRLRQLPTIPCHAVANPRISE